MQRLMADGYGLGAEERDWKTCALLRVMKVMAADLAGGTSFMEDYTYHLHPNGHLILGTMLEICESIAADKPSLEVHPLGIGGKEDPVRLVFTAPPGPAINASIIDLGNRFRLVVNEVDVVKPPKPLPKLPVAAPFGNAGPISRPPARRGFTRAAPTTPASATPSPPSTWKTSPKSPAWNWW